MTRAKISEYDAVASNNTDVNGVNIAEGCPPSGMNNMGREIMAALKRFQVGSDGDGVTVGGNLVVSGSSTVNTFTAGPVSATTLNTSGAVVFNDAGADVDFRVEGDTNANLLFVDAGNDRVGICTNAPLDRLTINEPDTVGTDRVVFRATTASGGALYFLANDLSLAAPTWAIGTGNSEPLAFNVGGTERMRILSSGGITFNGDTAAANALDDYEEGTFTPTIVGGTTAGTGTYGNQLGTYTKIGNRVLFSIYITWTAHTGTGAMSIDGLPFTIPTGNASFAPMAVYMDTAITLTANHILQMRTTPNSTKLLFAQYEVGGDGASTVTMDTNAGLMISGHYFV